MSARFTEMNMIGMLASRMGWNMDDPRCPFKKWVPVLLDSKDMVSLYVVHNDVAQLFEDEKALFPSDALVTKLRLLGG